MKPVIYLVALLSLLGIIPGAWAGAAEEISAIGQQRTAAEEKGDVDVCMVAFADDAAFTPSLQPFRVEGKAAIREYFTTFFQTYPTRHIVGRQGSTLVYANDTVVVPDAYLILTLTDKGGTVSVYHLRASTTWVKMGS
jgi:ketosteroid isomerase-like protein